MLDGFARAVKTYVKGSTGKCEWEPKWAEHFPFVAKPGDSPEAKQKAAEYLASADVQCSMLKLRPDACHGCKHNPLGEAQKQIDKATLDQYRNDIANIETLHDCVRMGLLKLEDIMADEFDMLRIFYWEIEAARASARMF